MAKYILAYDLGTTACKASVFDVDGQIITSHTAEYETIYPQPGWHEQRPMDWWQVFVECTNKLVGSGKFDINGVECLALSGHSLAVVPVDMHGRLLRESVPIWSDSRADNQAQEFFRKIDHSDWYRMTGNGFRPSLYSVFKILWYMEHEPEIVRKTFKVLGTKDFINLKLTGQFTTDYSYASGSGVYDLLNWQYSDRLVALSGIPFEILPDIKASTDVVGKLTKEASAILRLPGKVKVICGGVDNSCMAAGSRNIKPGRMYTSLGASAWIAVSSGKPLLGQKVKPFVFAHVIPRMYTSAVSIYSAGSAFKWIRDNICTGVDKDYSKMTKTAEESTVGAHHLLFNPSLSGGATAHSSPDIRGGFMGLDLSHKRCDLIRSAMEGIAMDLRLALDVLKGFGVQWDEMLLSGGGSRSKLWRQIFADVYNTIVVKTNIDQEAASLGAAAVAAVGAGLWRDFSKIDDIHKIQDVRKPIPENVAIYERLIPIFKQAGEALSQIGDELSGLPPE